MLPDVTSVITPTLLLSRLLLYQNRPLVEHGQRSIDIITCVKGVSVFLMGRKLRSIQGTKPEVISLLLANNVLLPPFEPVSVDKNQHLQNGGREDGRMGQWW